MSKREALAAVISDALGDANNGNLCKFVADTLLERYIIVHRAQTCDGEIIEDSLGIAVSAGSGPEFAVGSTTDNPNWLRNRAVNLLNIADYVENREEILAAKEIEAQAALNKRRDELAGELHIAGATWFECAGPTRRAIDRIIDMETAR